MNSLFFRIHRVTICNFFYGQADISKPGRYAKSQEDEGQPGSCLEFSVQPHANAKPDENGECHRESQAAVISQFPY